MIVLDALVHEEVSCKTFRRLHNAKYKSIELLMDIIAVYLNGMLHCEFVRCPDSCIRLHLQKCDISHFTSPLLFSCIHRVCYVSMLCFANVVVPFVLNSPEQRTAPVLRTLTTGLHSSRGLESQALSLLSESQEPRVI